MEYHLTVANGYESLRANAAEYSAELLQLGSLTVNFYAPREVDRQEPHTRDEVYVVASGAATFRCCGKEIAVAQGDVLTVPAHQEHLFVNLTPDFATWVFFYGPEEGERASASCCEEPGDTVTEIRPAAPGRMNES